MTILTTVINYTPKRFSLKRIRACNRESSNLRHVAPVNKLWYVVEFKTNTFYMTLQLSVFREAEDGRTVLMLISSRKLRQFILHLFIFL